MRKFTRTYLSVLGLSLLIIVLLYIVKGFELTGLKYNLVFIVVCTSLLIINIQFWKKGNGKEKSPLDEKGKSKDNTQINKHE